MVMLKLCPLDKHLHHWKFVLLKYGGMLKREEICMKRILQKRIGSWEFCGLIREIVVSCLLQLSREKIGLVFKFYHRVQFLKFSFLM